MKLINFFLAIAIAQKGNHADLCTLNVCTKCHTVLHMYKTGSVFYRCRSMINSKLCCGKFIIGDIFGMSRPRFWPHYWIRFAMLHSLCSSNFFWEPSKIGDSFLWIIKLLKQSSGNTLTLLLRPKINLRRFWNTKGENQKTKYKTEKSNLMSLENCCFTKMIKSKLHSLMHLLYDMLIFANKFESSKSDSFIKHD